jgi:hypothetical protein
VCGKPRKAKSAGRSRVNDLGPVYPSSRSPLFSSASPTREPILFARNVSRNLESANQSDGCATRITANYRDKAASRRGTRRILDIYMLIIHYPDHNNTGTIAGELLRGRAVGREIRATSRDFRTAANPVARDAFVRGGGGGGGIWGMETKEIRRIGRRGGGSAALLLPTSIVARARALRTR